MLGRVANAMGTRDSEVESTLEKVKRRRKSHVVDLDAAQVPVSYDDTKHADLRRKHLLHLTRRADPLHLVWDVRHLTYTALPRVVRSVNMLCIIGAYAASAVTTRLGVWSSESAMLVDEMDSIDGMELLVTFNLCVPPTLAGEHRLAWPHPHAYHPCPLPMSASIGAAAPAASSTRAPSLRACAPHHQCAGYAPTMCRLCADLAPAMHAD